MKRKRVFFGNNGLSPIDIIEKLMSSEVLDLDWPQFKNKKVIFTHLGRIGNVLACKLWNVKESDEILVPSYNCGSEVDPFLWYGMKAVMYRVDNNFNLDLEDIRKRLTNKTKIIYVIHYFGWPQSLIELRKICNDNDIYLMEDCALSLFSNGPIGPIGLDGDAAIHSFRKTLPVPDGAALVLPLGAGEYLKPPEKTPPFPMIAKITAGYVERWLLRSIHTKPLLGDLMFYCKQFLSDDRSKPTISDEQDMPLDYYFSENVLPWTISRISSGILSSINPKEVYAARRKNFIQLYQGISGTRNLQILVDCLPTGVCPLFMPLMVNDVSKWVKKLNNFGVDASTWWHGFNQKLNWSEFPEAKHLKQNMLVMPVHQYLNEGDVEYMIRCVRDTSVLVR